jgi:hypothetical protein
MSMPQILATLKEALLDPDVGFTQAVESLAEPGSAVIRSDFALIDWILSGRPTDTRAPNLMVRPRRWVPVGNASDTGHRDALAELEIGYEYFGAEPDDIQENVTLAATAIAKVIDQLRAFSDATGGTIIDVQDPIAYDFGQFTGPTSHGFLATLTLSERSTL